MKKLNWLLILLCALPLSGISQNLVSSQSWTAGSGTIGIFEANGIASENIREMGTGPNGSQTILWKAVPNGGNDADGGWNTTSFAIANAKMYRFSVWIKKTNSTDGTTYFGCGSNEGILNLSGTSNGNPYFWYGDLPALNKWYLLVGYIHASDDPSTSNYGGIYDGETGAKVSSTTDFKFNTGTTTAYHRTYLYYDPNTSDRQFFFGPEVSQCAGNQVLVETVGSGFVNGNMQVAGSLFTGGNAGIGTTSPEAKFTITQIGNGWNDGLRINRDASNYLTLTEDVTDIRLKNWGSGGILFFTSTAEALRILNNGNVGIGTPSPAEKLTINGTGSIGAEIVTDGASSSRPVLSFKRGTGFWNIGMNMDVGNTDNFHFRYNGTSYPFTIQASTGNVGIGTSSPQDRLDVAGDAGVSSRFKFKVADAYTGNTYGVIGLHTGTPGKNLVFYNYDGPVNELMTLNGTTGTAAINNGGLTVSGNVGVGTTTPQAKLQVSNGDLLLQNQTSGYPSLWLKNVGGTNTLKLDYNSIIGAGSNLIVRSGSTSAIVLNDTGGNVGIGTTSPDQKLTVNGTIHGTRVKVDLTVPGPDYVFEKDYNLPSLEEIKKYIDEHKRLPEAPSAVEMEKNGIDVAEMNMLLLKKVEELTLYLLEQQKQLNAQQKEIQDLKDQKK